jgi:hypothetical protein
MKFLLNYTYNDKLRNYKNLNNEDFRRLVGIKKNTFDKMIEILKIEEDKRRKRGGYANKLSIEERLLMTFEYLREYILNHTNSVFFKT